MTALLLGCGLRTPFQSAVGSSGGGGGDPVTFTDRRRRRRRRRRCVDVANPELVAVHRRSQGATTIYAAGYPGHLSPGRQSWLVCHRQRPL